MNDDQYYIKSNIYDLKPLYRLATAYAGRQTRHATVALFALDQRLAAIVRGASESMLAQLRLAWWRDALSAPAPECPAGEPLLDLLRSQSPDTRLLVSMVDAWEELASAERLDRDAISRFVAGRAQAWVWLAQVGGHSSSSEGILRAGSEWALIDLRDGLNGSDERAEVEHVVAMQAWSPIRWPRGMGPLAVLHGLAIRARRKPDARMLDSPRALLTAMRLGIFRR